MIDTDSQQHQATQPNQATYDLSLLESSAEKWDQSPGLRTVYRSIFNQMELAAVGTRWLELGSGAGFFKRCCQNVVTSDIQKTRFVDKAVSAYAIEGAPETWDTILAMDMLHHLTTPFRFLESASKALMPKGRIVLAEPAATAWGSIFYKLFHHEPCRTSTIGPPFEFQSNSKGEFANMGMGQALFKNHKQATQSKLKQMGLSLKALNYRDVFAYPSTGGLSKQQIFPTRIIKLLLKGEALLPQAALRVLGLRMIIVLEKTP